MQTTKRSYTDLADYANAHHAPELAFRDAGWSGGHVRRGRPALMFVTRSGNRWRFTDDQKPTYDHDKGYKPCWYGLELAVKMSSEISPIVDCNGAPSTIVAQWFGIPAFSLQSGEGASLNADLISQVEAIYHGPIIVAYDCDEAGRRAAVRRVRDWRAAGFECWAIDLAMGFDGADLADFAATGELISECKRIEIPAEPDRPVSRHVNTSETEDDLIRKAELALDALNPWRCDDMHAWVQVGMALKATIGEAAFGLWESWSARSEKFKPGECQKRWATFKRNDLTIGSLFKWADEDSSRAWRDQLRRKNYGQNRGQKADTDFARNCSQTEETASKTPGQSDSVRTAELSYAHQSIGPVMEVWTEAIDRGLIAPSDPVDVKYLTCLSEALNRNVSERTIRQGLKQGREQFFANLAHIYSTSKEEDSQITTTGVDNQRTGTTTSNPCARPGRKSECYVLLPKADMLKNLARLSVAPILRKAFPSTDQTLAPACEGFLQALGLEGDEAKAAAAELEKRYAAAIKSQPGYGKAIARARAEYARLVRSFADERSTPLVGEFATGTEYVACFARSIVVAAGGQAQIPRATWCAKLGRPDRALPAVFKRAGIHVEKDVYAKVAITSLGQLQAVKAEFDAEYRGYPAKLQSSLKKSLMTFRVDGPMLGWAETELRYGATVELLYRQANRQSLVAVADQPVPVIAPEPIKAKEPAQMTLIEATYNARYFRLMVLAWWIKSWTFPEPESAETVERSPRERWDARWLKALFGLVIPLAQVADQDGVIAPYSIQLAFAELLGPSPPMATA